MIFTNKNTIVIAKSYLGGFFFENLTVGGLVGPRAIEI